MDKKLHPDIAELDTEKPDYIVQGELANHRARFDYDTAQRLKRRADWRMMPLLIVIYLIAKIDSNIVSQVAKEPEPDLTKQNLPAMNKGQPSNVLTQLGMTQDDWALVSTVFTAGFVVSEIPSNLLIKWSGPRLHYTRILVLWSIAQTCQAAATNKSGILACRFLVGLFEGGLYPGIMFHLLCWYRPDEIAVRMAAIGLLGQFSGVISALLAYGFSYAGGPLSGWQYIFLLTGLLGIAFGGVTFLFCPDWPDSADARFPVFTEEEGRFMAARLPPSSARSSDVTFDKAAILAQLKSPLLYCFTLLQVSLISASRGVQFWLPSLIANFNLTSSPAQSQLLNIPVAFVALFSALAAGWVLDNDTRVPRPLLMIGALVIMIGLYLGLMFATNTGALYALILLTFVPATIEGSILMPLRVQTLVGSSGAAFALAFQNCIGNSAPLYTGFFFASRFAPRYTASFGICIAFAALAAIVTGVTWYLIRDVERQTRRIAKLRRAEGKEGRVALQDVRLQE